MMNRILIGFVGVLTLVAGRLSLFAAEPQSADLFASKNRVAWCIVPFDSKKRGPEDRAAMLEKLGFSKFAYDYRVEHIPTFDAEIEALKRHKIELTAWWFPTSLNDEAKMTLAIFEKHQVTPQLWVTGGGGATTSEQEQRQRVLDEAARIRPIAEAAGKIGCKVALYNHGGWFGEPENQIAIIQELKLPNVGIVYNQHHGHDHLARFPDLLKQMKPYLYTLNLNGMVPDGERKGQKIMPLGQGTLDLKLLKIIRDSGYTGPIGILGHTDDDAEARLQDNLDGLEWLLPQLNGKPAAAKPKLRTPVPVAQGAAAVPAANLPRLTDGKFGKALDGRAGGAFVTGHEEFRQFPITVECWTKLVDKGPYNILVANDLKSSGTHWELFTMAGTGNFTVYTPGFTPDHCHTTAMICNGQWHHVAMILEPKRIRLFVDGQIVATQACERSEMKSVAGDLAIANLVDKGAGYTGLIDEVRISRGIRSFDANPTKPYEPDEATLGLWHFDELIEGKRFGDAMGKNPALAGQSLSQTSSPAQKSSRIEGHWGEDALGFRWTEADSRDDRLGQMNTGPFFSGSITGAGGTIYKGIVVRVGPQQTHAICYDTELMRPSAGWAGFLRFDAARYGIIVPPRIEGEVTFSTPILAGVSRQEAFLDHRKTSPFGPLDKTFAHYKGLYRHGQRVVLKFTVAERDAAPNGPSEPTVILESPWLEEGNGITAQTRTLTISPSTSPLSLMIADQKAHVRMIASTGTATLQRGPEQAQVLVIPPHAATVTVKVLIASPATNEAAFEKLVAASPVAEDLLALTMPGPIIWGEPLVTTGEVSKSAAPYVVDTITLPFENRFQALMFCGGHDFLPDGRAVVCTLHGDVWLVDGIDKTLQRITWRRYATGLFQPLGIKVVSGTAARSGSTELYVVGRDQITRLHDTNHDGEADFYENFNNDAFVSLNGHEYVTCLETDRAGNFYFVKGNCDSAIPHDGSVLRVSPDGSKLEVYATGFRNANGMAIGPQDQISVAPQEGEWTPASAVFSVHQGGFYGAMMSHHRPQPPTDFERPFSWFPRLADNSCGGQVWVTSDRWGPLSQLLLHLSYGQCKLRLLLQEELAVSANRTPSNPAIPFDAAAAVTNRKMNGGSTEFPLNFASGIHRGRFNPHDGQLYVTGLKGWVSSAVNDGCFQRVRYTGQPVDLLVAMKTYRNGVALTFTNPLNRDDAENIDHYELEAWNYRWTAEYGSPDFKPLASGQIGRETVEPLSATLLADGKTVFLELTDLKPVDQLGISYTLRTASGATLEQTAYLTLNGISAEVLPEDQLHRSGHDAAKSALLARLVPGVTLRAPDLAADTSIPRRLVAWSELGHKSSGNETGSERTIEGYLKIPFTGEYRFHADRGGLSDATLPAAATLEIQDVRHELGQSDVVVRLSKGYIPFRVHKRVTPPDSDFRLMWETTRFPRELIPATALFHEIDTTPAARRREQSVQGRALYARHQCARCHQDGPGQSLPQEASLEIESLRQGPRLEGIGSRLERDWLAAWLRNPHHLRPQATMPALFESPNDPAVEDLVAFLGTLRELGEQPARTVPNETAREQGEQLFERQGCIACHTLAATETHPEWNRISLHFVQAKFQPGQLERFLLDPQQHHPGSHMPNFRLSQDEAGLLAGFLERQAKGTINADLTNAKGNPERGQKLFSAMRCDHCHQLTTISKLTPPDVRSAWNTKTASGCLRPAGQPSRTAPSYSWTDAEREALNSYLTEKPGGFVSHQGGNRPELERMLATLRCTACHARDGSNARWPEIVAEEGSGKLPESAPQLTWVGEKLQGPWIAQLLQGKIEHKPRPWITARMPSFPAYAEIVAHAMAAEHGVPFHEPLVLELDPGQIETGQKLAQRDGGLDCRQCHALGNEKPRGDAATQIALGINFAFSRNRLRPEFALRQMLDPPRYDIGSRMPRFAPDLQTTAAKQIEGGNAKKQFEAIKQYLWSLKTEKTQD